jgi:hypothetical protein
MVRDDTYPLPENKIRAPFRDMTTVEAEYHAETMWPYFDGRVAAAVQETLQQQLGVLMRDRVMDTLADMVEINASTPEGRARLKMAFRMLGMLADLRQFVASICVKCILPWTVAAIAGIFGLLFKDSVPEMVKLFQYVASMVE